MQKQKNKKPFWLLIGVLVSLLAAPNGAIIRNTVLNVDPVMFNVIRFSLVALVLTPYLIKHRTALRGEALKNAIKVGLFLAVATLSFVYAAKLSQASYVAIIMLLSPIFFVLLASKINNDKIDRRAFAGITLAAIGAFIIVLLPIALRQSGGAVFFPLATLLGLITAVSFPLAVIYSKKAHLSGMPVVSVVGIGAWISLVASLAVLLHTGNWSLDISGSSWLGILYVSIVVQLFVRGVNNIVYEKLGAAENSVLAYLEGFLAVLVPTIALSEKLSPAMVVGGSLIIAGVYVVEYKRTSHHKHEKTIQQY